MVMGATLKYPDACCAFLVRKAVVPLTAVALLVGTGGEATAAYYRQRGPKGYAPLYHAPAPVGDAMLDRSPAEDLARIRAVLKPAITDLASALGVSRQAVYDWQSGRPIAAENATRLADLARAADVLAAEGLTATTQILRRPVSSGKNLFAIVREGGSAEGAATKLCAILRREAQQREALNARLANRKRPTTSIDDYGIPALSELR